MKKFLLKISRSDWIALALLTFFSIIYSFMTVRQHNQFQTFGWDLGVFDQGIWLWSRFKFPFTTFHDIYWLGDHFHLSLILLSPLYWIFPDVRALLVAQAFLVCFGGLPLYILAKKITRSIHFSLAALFSYLTFFSLQWHIFSGFHEFTLLPLSLGLLFLFWEQKRAWHYWITFWFTIFIKEELGFLLAAFGIWQFFTDKKRKHQALFTIFLGLFSSILLIKYVIPLIAGKNYLHLDYGKSGYTIFEVMVNIIKNPVLLAEAFFDSPEKINTMFLSFAPWLILPFLSPLTLILTFEQLATRFLDYQKTIRWTAFFIYNLPMAPILFWSSIYGLKNSQKFKLNKKFFIIISVLMLLISITIDFFKHAPLNSLLKSQFYYNEGWIADNRQVLKCIPREASVAAQNNLVPWLSQREKIKVLPDGIGYDYIAVDFHPGQSENNFREPGMAGTKELVKLLQQSKEYRIFCEKNNALVLIKSE